MPRFAVTPNGKVGLVLNQLDNGIYRLMIWGQDESYIGEATIQKDDWQNPFKDKFLEVTRALKAQGQTASFF